uniref:NADH-quinone oxidoreductase subunit J n=1 Tax=Roseihalotalea indica TaxID=2867963 RepID=A0AA49JJ57_9BACT|nr:NADH-quinone oxidoreductase subunit J [Tunicatimonas sp. TK19036]
MNTISLIFLVFFGLVAIWFGWRVFMTSSMVRSALSLLASMAAIGAMFFTMEAEFLGVLQIMMMATEMSIMAIFMMMYMMDPGGLSGMDMSHQKKPSISGGVLVGILAAGVAVFTSWGGMTLGAPFPAEQNHDLGIEIMKRSMMIFESAGVTILVAMIAATATALPYKKNQV